MDFIRTGMRTEMHLWGPDAEPVPVRWFKCCDSAKAFDGPHLWHNPDWQCDDEDRGPFYPLGSRGAYDNLRPYVEYEGTKPHGPLHLYNETADPDVDFPYLTDDQGALPECRKEVPLPVGGVGIGGSAPMREFTLEDSGPRAFGYGFSAVGPSFWIPVPEATQPGDRILAITMHSGSSISVVPPDGWTAGPVIDGAPGRIASFFWTTQPIENPSAYLWGHTGAATFWSSWFVCVPDPTEEDPVYNAVLGEQPEDDPVEVPLVTTADEATYLVAYDRTLDYGDWTETGQLEYIMGGGGSGQNLGWWGDVPPSTTDTFGITSYAANYVRNAFWLYQTRNTP